MANFIKSENKDISNSVTIPTSFLSNNIRKMMIEDLGVIPKNVYVSNAAGDWVFIRVVKDKQVYILTDSFYLDEAIEDYESLK
jgi:hypothetical protein